MALWPPVVLKTHKWDIATDVIVEYRAPNTGVFTWNLSQWNNGDKWAATSTISWKTISTEVVNFELDGSTPLDNAFQQLVAQTASLQLAGDTLNPDFTNLAYVGLPIRVSVVCEDGQTYLLFTGSVRDYQATYVPGQRRTNMVLSLSDNLDTYLNTVLTVALPAQTALNRFSYISNAMFDLGFTSHKLTVGDFVVDTTTFTAITGSYTVQELITPILQYYRTFTSYIMPSGSTTYTELKFYKSALPGFALSDYADQENQVVRYSTITTGRDSSLIYNQVKVVDENDVVISTKSNYENARLYGTNSLDFKTNLTNPATAGAVWADTVIAKNKNRTFTGLEINPIHNGYLSVFVTCIGFYGNRTAYTVLRRINGVDKYWQTVKTRFSLSIDRSGIRITMDLAEYQEVIKCQK